MTYVWFGLLSQVVIALHVISVKAIIGGKPALEGQFPYHVSIQYYGNDYCSGGIIDEYYVISAAHCFIDIFEEIQSIENATRHVRFKSQLKILPGFVNLNHTHSDYYWEKLHGIEKLYIPLRFFIGPKSLAINGTFDFADLVVIKLEKPLNLGTNLRKLDLPKDYNSSHFNDKIAIVTGYGWNYLINETNINQETHHEERMGKSYNMLHFAVAKISTSFFHNLGFGQCKENICAQIIPNNQIHPAGVCNRDSGGPLVYGRKIQILIGIISRSPTNCNESFAPAIYTDVRKYYSMIKKSMSDEEDSSIVSIDYSKVKYTSKLFGHKVIY